MSLSPEDIDRHRRHILLKEIGGPGVAKLRAASVSIIGAGALGGPAALYLAAAGVGRIELWDDDRVERSNLQRQIQFSDADTGTERPRPSPPGSVRSILASLSPSSCRALWKAPRPPGTS